MLFGPAETNVTSTHVAGRGVGFDVDRLQPGRRPIIWPGVPALALDQDLRVAADLRAVEGELVRVDPRLQPLQPLVHDFARDLVLHRRGRRARARRIFERISRGVTHRVDDLQRRLEIVLGLAGEADDEVAGKRDVGAGRAHPLEVREIGFGACGCGSSP